MKTFLRSALFLTLVACSACTTRGVYEGIRAGERNRCNEMKDTERERCLAKVQDDFDTYNRKRRGEGESH